MLSPVLSMDLIACRILHKRTDNILRLIQDLVKEGLALWGVPVRGFWILGFLKRYLQHFEWWLLIFSNKDYACLQFNFYLQRIYLFIYSRFIMIKTNLGIKTNYYMAKQIQAFWLVLSWSGFRHTDRFHGNGLKLCIFCFRKLANSKQAWPECHIINYLLT